MGRKHKKEKPRYGEYQRPDVYEVGLMTGETVDVTAHYVWDHSASEMESDDNLVFRRWKDDINRKGDPGQTVATTFAKGNWTFWRLKGNG